MKKKEILWFIGTFLLVIILLFSPSGFKDFDLSGDIDINLHDTYFVIPSMYIFILITTLIFFGVSLIRMLRRNFKNLTANLIFMISDSILILIFTFLIALVNSMQEIPGSSEYSHLSGGIIENTGNGFNLMYYGLVGFQLISILLLSISGIKTGLNYRRT